MGEGIVWLLGVIVVFIAWLRAHKFLWPRMHHTRQDREITFETEGRWEELAWTLISIAALGGEIILVKACIQAFS